jgi:hypothetical protein
MTEAQLTEITNWFRERRRMADVSLADLVAHAEETMFIALNEPDAVQLLQHLDSTTREDHP